MRYLPLAICLMMLSCRDIQPPTSPTTISGYQLNGIFTTSDGSPIPDAGVRLYYDYEDAGTGPVDTLQVVVTDSIPIPPDKQLPRIKVLSVAPLLADAIKRIHFNESVSKLFE